MNISRVVAETTSNTDGNFSFTPVEAPSDHRIDGLRYFLVADAKDCPIGVGWVLAQANFGPPTVWLSEEECTLSGKVVDEHGMPIKGARVSPALGIDLLPGVPSTVTNASGLFLLTRLPRIVPGETVLRQLQFRVQHPDYPEKLFNVEKLPRSVRFELPAGCTLAGEIQCRNPDVSMEGIVVTVQNMGSSGDLHAVTDASGKYRIVVPQGNHSVLVEDERVVAAALTDIECRKGQTLQLDPMHATEGGWIEGLVVNTKTQKPMALTDSGEPIKIGLFGPGRPLGKVISPTALGMTDKDGRFRIRTASGDNFPYLVNIHGQRMAWDTKKKPPVVVKEGQVTQYNMAITPPLTPDEKMANAQKIVDALPKENEARIHAIIEEFRKLNHTVDETELWAMLVREAKAIGSPAVPALCKELEATNEPRMIIRLCFSLRAIGDASAVPSLIRTIPKTLLSTGDYGLIVENADLHEFMQQHSISPERGGRHFTVGQVVKEHQGTLARLTGRRIETKTLFSIRRSGDLRNLARQQEYYHNFASDWAKWWEANFTRFNVAPQHQTVNLPEWQPPDLSDYPTGLGLTANAKIGGGIRGMVLTPVGDDDNEADFFKDLDTGKEPHWPKHLPARNGSPDIVKAAAEWAAEQGLDLMCIAMKDDRGNVQYVLQGIGLQLWEIDPLDAKNIEKRVATGKLPEGRKLTSSAILHFDSKSQTEVAQRGTSFLYVTRDEGLGLITITDFVTEARDITGQMMTQQGVGFHRGVRFDIQTIAR